MRQTQLFIVFAVFAALLLTPEMLCLIPGVQMTMDEHECCKRMKADCGKVPMQAHSCCSKVEPQGPAIAAAGKIVVQPPPVSIAELTIPIVSLSNSFQTLWRIDTSPPLARASQSLNILRI